MQTMMIYSESGGATKSTTAVSLATVAAEDGKRVILVDLDPRGATTKWLDAQPVDVGLDVGAILGNQDPRGWADELAVPSPFHENLRVIPSDRSVSARETDDPGEVGHRLADSLEGVPADLVIIDCPNRQGGSLIYNALTAAESVIYAATPTADGVDGFLGAQESVTRYNATSGRQAVAEAGIIVGGYKETVTPREATHSIEQMRETGLLLTPLIPHRTIVGEVRYSHDWYGRFRKGAPVAQAYRELARKVIR